MPRKRRVDYAGALHHVMSRGNRKGPIVMDDQDRRHFMAILAATVLHCRWELLSYCLMDNHYHLLLRSVDGNLSVGMQRLGSIFAARMNRRHGRVGHHFQGRYTSVLVEDESHLLGLDTYIVGNPVRAGIVSRPEDWPWSSFRAASGRTPAPQWLAVDQLHAVLGLTGHRTWQRYARNVTETLST